jgi:hypothetical protein
MPTIFKLIVVIALAIITTAILLILLLDNGTSPRDKADDESLSNGTRSDELSKDKTKIAELRDGEFEIASHEKAAIEPRFHGLTIIGHVFDRESDQAIRKACVATALLPYQENMGGIEGYTDEEGRFSIESTPIKDLKPSSLDITISAEGYKTFKTSIPFNSEKKTIEIGDFYLTRTNEFIIRVVDESIEPIPGACVRFFTRFVDIPILERVTDRDGCIRVIDQDLTPGDRKSNVGLHVTAKGMSDFFYYNRGQYNEASMLPDEIVMIPERTWSGVVVDAGTTQGIHDATIDLSVSRMFKHITGAKRIKTDEAGHFEVPLFSISEDLHYSLSIRAKGYKTWWSSKDLTYPSQIELHKIPGSEYTECLAVDAHTDQPLAGVKICDALSAYDEITDDTGLFRLLLDRERSDLLVLYIPEMKLAYRDEIYPKDYKTLPLVIPFDRLFNDKLYVLVKDEVGRPVTNARVHSTSKNVNRDQSTVTTDGAEYTGADGIASLTPWIIGNGEISFRITHPDFCTYCSGPLFIQDILDKVDLVDSSTKGEVVNLQFVLRRGTALQNIKVVNDKGVPVRCATLVADLTMGDGSEERLIGPTDRDGFCSLTFPPFAEGILYLSDRPDTILYIDYNTVLQQEDITLILYNEIVPSLSIQGIVRDESGNPLDDILIRPSVIEGKKQWFDWSRTKENGSFCFPAFPDSLYNISIAPVLRKDYWYIVQDQYSLSAGAYVDVTVVSVNGVEVSLRSLFQNKGFLHYEYDAWLEDEHGRTISAKTTKMDLRKALFLDVPEGNMRAKIITGDGEQFLTPYFEIKRGKGLRTVIEIDE